MKFKIVFAAALGVVVLGLAVKWAFEVSGGSVKRTDEQLKDLSVAADPGAADVDVYQSLGRLARSQDPKALELALERATDPARITREGAANALGFFTDDRAFEALQKLLNDPEENVRVRTLQALGNAKEARREQLVKTFITREGATLREKTLGHAALAKMTSDVEVKAEAIKYLALYANSGSELEHYIAFSKLLEAVPNDEAAIDVAHAKLGDSKNPEMVALAIRHLSVLKDEKLKRSLPGFLKSKNPMIKEAAQSAAASMQ